MADEWTMDRLLTDPGAALEALTDLGGVPDSLHSAAPDKEHVVAASGRASLPARRVIEHVDVTWRGLHFVVGLGVREVFISSRAKTGSPVDTAARDIAILMSLCLQYGCPVDVMERALTKGADGNPEGLAGEVARMM